MNKILVAMLLQAGLVWGQAAFAPPVQDPSPLAPSPLTLQETNQAAAPAPTHQRATAAIHNANGKSEGTPPQEAPSTLHLVVGRSLFLVAAVRMKRIYVSNPATVDALAATPYQLVITAKAPGTSSLVVWKESGGSTMYTVCADLDIADLQVALGQAFPADHIDVQAKQGKIYLSGTAGSDGAADQAAKLAGIYSKDVVNSLTIDPRHPPQVKLQVRFVELDRSKMTEFGFNFLSAGKNSAATTTQQFGQPTVGQQGSGGQSTTPILSELLNLFYFNRDLNLGVTIQDLQQKGVLQILAEPSLTTIDGQSAKFLAGGEFPFPIVQGSSGGLTSITISFKPYGVKLEFTPFVNPDGTIRLKVRPEVSALDYTNAVTISGYTVPALSTRHAETEVELKNGQSFGISGLLDRRITDNLSKIPGISAIPILGQLFRSKNLNHAVTELIVIVTPTIVDPITGDDVQESIEPKWPIPFLDPKEFDLSLTKANDAPSTGTGVVAPK